MILPAQVYCEWNVPREPMGNNGTKMKKETGRTIRELGYFASLGMSVALAIFMGLALGLWLDKVFDTKPLLMFVFLALGIGAGFSNIIRAGKKGKKYRE